MGIRLTILLIARCSSVVKQLLNFCESYFFSLFALKIFRPAIEERGKRKETKNDLREEDRKRNSKRLEGKLKAYPQNTNKVKKEIETRG
jgi:hypothetical protein